jgi:penicillin-binding protein 1B
MPSPSDRSPQRGVVQQPERKSPRRTARKPARKPPRTAGARRWPVVVLRLLAAAVVVGALVFMYLDAYIQREFSGKKWAVPAMVYGRPLELYAGAQVGPRALTEELETLGYRAAGGTAGAGTYSASGSTVSIATRGFRFWDGEEPARRLRVAFAGNSVQTVRDEQGAEVALARLEPVHIGGIYPAHNEDRILVRVSDVPPLLIRTLMAVEDQNFDSHHGVSLKGIARAMWVNVSSGALEQGGSTLTQQLVKNFFLTRERTITRKLMELAMALVMELRYSKEEILEAYLNEIYLGQDGHRAIHGFGLASHYYFNRPIAELGAPQIALLVGMVRGPSYYDPWRHPERSRERRDTVLALMVEQEVIGAEEAASIAKMPLGVGDREQARSKFYPAYLDLVRRQLRRDYSEEGLTSEGLQIFTGLDPAVQRAAEASLQETLAKIESDFKARGKPQQGLEGAVIVTRVDSGEVLAVVGGRNSRVAGFNRALDAQRPVGSLMKPAVFLTALEDGRYTLLTPLDDGPVAYKGANGQVWRPRNYDREDHGMVRLHRALAQSYNQSTARLGLELGIERVVDTIHRLGVDREVPALPSVALGAVALSPIEVAEMYQTIASGGFSSPLSGIREVMDASGEPLTRYPVAVEQKVRQSAVYLLEYALKEVVSSGTARSAYNRLPAGLVVAGKTGTTDDQRDSWFAGYSGDLLAVVWIGRDDNGVTALTGATGALPAWTGLMAAVSREPRRARAPGGVTETWVDDVGGGLSGEGCPDARLMPFLNGTEPDYESSCTGSRLRWPWSGGKAAEEPGAAAERGAAPQPGAAPQQQEKARDRWWKRWFGGDR